MTHLLQQRHVKLYLVLASFFLTNAIVAEFMGVKIFSLDDTFGFQPIAFNFFGQALSGFNLTTGVLLWPFVFVMTDIINEYFGLKGVRFISFVAVAMIGYAYLMLTLAMGTSPASWWINSSIYGNDLDYNKAYIAVFSQGNNIIVGSLIAFLIGQIVDVFIFHWIKKKTWRVAPVAIDVRSFADIPEHAKLNGPFQLVKGHTRLGLLQCCLKNGRISEDSLHAIYLMRSMKQ